MNKAANNTRRPIKLAPLVKKDFAEWDLQGKYQVTKIVGNGSYGQVAQAKCMKTGRQVAIKKMDNIFDDEIDCKRILREITLLRKLKHPCVVNLIEMLVPPNPETFTTIYMVMEYADSDLKKIMKSNLNLEILHIQTMVYNLLCAVKFLHESKVIHRDIKPANVLINEDCSVKLCDFGLARSLTGLKVNSEQILKQNSMKSDASSST
jgi:mitogen-activated protein kinase 1/3